MLRRLIDAFRRPRTGRVSFSRRLTTGRREAFVTVEATPMPNRRRAEPGYLVAVTLHGDRRDVTLRSWMSTDEFEALRADVG